MGMCEKISKKFGSVHIQTYRGPSTLPDTFRKNLVKFEVDVLNKLLGNKFRMDSNPRAVVQRYVNPRQGVDPDPFVYILYQKDYTIRRTR